MQTALQEAGAHTHIMSKELGVITSADGQDVEVDKSFLTVASVIYDAVFIPGGQQSIEALMRQGDAIHFVNEAFKHCKPIAATDAGVDMLLVADMRDVAVASAKSKGKLCVEHGVVTSRNASAMDASIQHFIEAISQHRHWGRAQKEQVPA